MTTSVSLDIGNAKSLRSRISVLAASLCAGINEPRL
jgi:hypothetical protein